MSSHELTGTSDSMTPEQVCRGAADWFDTIDDVLSLTRITGGEHDGLSLADLAGRDREVQRDLRAVADLVRDVALRLDRLHTTMSMNEHTDYADALHSIIADLFCPLRNGGIRGEDSES